MDEGKTQKRPRRSFTEEFKAGAVRLVLDEGKTIPQVARDLDLTESALRTWVERARADRTEVKTGLITVDACCAHHSSVGAYVTAAWRIVRRRRSRKKSTNTSRNRTSKVCTKSHAHVTWFRRNVDQLWPSPPDRERRMYR